jgi:hypothetical protein
MAMQKQMRGDRQRPDKARGHAESIVLCPMSKQTHFVQPVLNDIAQAN